MTQDNISQILNLRSHPAIAKELADRQLNVISKGYQYLSKSDENNVLYIADEVGLGKTYIAAGIAMLFRHYSKAPAAYKDLIIVPKKNLQTKWVKELNNFLQFNYRANRLDDLHDTILKDAIKETSSPINAGDPISIFRTTSFSSIIATSKKGLELYNHLKHNTFNNNPLAIEVFDSARKHFKPETFGMSEEMMLQRLCGYLLNAASPEIDCLIVDEAHNFKYGPKGAIRNEVTSRFLGAVKDALLLQHFPQLLAKLKFPLAKKIICLSATPKDRHLTELKEQLNCFTNKHILSSAVTRENIEQQIPYFLIRGNLEYNVQTGTVSRNQCREEHRKGNVNKSIVPEILKVEDTFEGIFWQLLQYKSIKHLNQRYNASFETGMIASFETYQLRSPLRTSLNPENQNEPEDPNVRGKDKEYENRQYENIQYSQDSQVLHTLVTSYHKQFNSYPPHPKQSKLEGEIIGQLRRQEKSLIFVRRVASSSELRRRLTAAYEKEIVLPRLTNLTGALKRLNTPELRQMLNSYQRATQNKFVTEHLDYAITSLLKNEEIRRQLLSYPELITDQNYQADGSAWLYMAFQSDDNQDFNRLVSDYILRSLKNIQSDLRQAAISAIINTYHEFRDNAEENTGVTAVKNQTATDNVSSGYFFLDYFRKGSKGYSYRKKMPGKSWFEINPFILNHYFPFMDFPLEGLNQWMHQYLPSNEMRKRQADWEPLRAAKTFLKQSATLSTGQPSGAENLPPGLKESTFLTDLLCRHCPSEMKEWIEKRMHTASTDTFFTDLGMLNAILTNIFRHGSGLLPGYLADSLKKKNTSALLKLVTLPASPFIFVLEEIKTIIKDFDLILMTNFPKKEESYINTVMRNLTPIVGTSGQDGRDRGILAAQFRMPGYPYVLVTTDIFREGEDLHTYCEHIYHYGIGWNPSDMEQRTGRIDRINSMSYRKINQVREVRFDNKIQVFFPYLHHSMEVNQIVQLLNNMNEFVNTFNKIENDQPSNSSVNISDQITAAQIPDQVRKKLYSKYDIENFSQKHAL